MKLDGNGIDFNPLYDNKEWDDTPVRKAADVEEAHDETKLDRKLKRKSRDGRKSMVYIHMSVSALIVLVAVGSIIGLIYLGFSYAFL
jgi:hypothetical protein